MKRMTSVKRMTTLNESATLAELTAQVRRLTHRADLQDLVFRYATACDRRDVTAWSEIFTPDARAKYGKDDWLIGSPDILAWLSAATQPTTWGHHFINPYAVDVDGDRADVLAYLLSHQIFAADLDAATMMTSRYQLQCVRAASGWRIDQLELTVGWYEVRSADQSLLP
jgi:SnoaL-like domain